MNFKTTILLIIILVAVGVVLFVTRDHETKTTEPAPASEKKLLDLNLGDVSKASVTPSDGKTNTFERSGANWRMTAPLTAPADNEQVTSLLDSILSLQSRGSVEPGGSNASVTGLDQPNFRIELTTKDGKTEKLAIGNKSPTGGNLYVQRDGAPKADLVAAEIYDQLDKPAKNFRDMRLVDVKSPEVYQVQITSPKGKLELNKGGEKWVIAGPTTMRADQREMTDLLAALTGLRAVEYVAEGPGTSADAKLYGLDVPAVAVSFSAQPATTQPSTQPAVTGSIRLGRYDDVMKRNVYAASSSTPAIAKVSASSLESFEKTALDLRDREVLKVDPEKVSSLSIAIDKPATTQPTSRPAVNSTVRIARQHEEKPATQPATTQATTLASSQPATAPSEPPTKWELTSEPKGPADDLQVDDLLAMLDPLRAEKFVEQSATTQPADRYVLTILTEGAAQPIEISISDPGGAKQPIASYNGASFEVGRPLIDRLEAKFAKSSARMPGSMGEPPMPR